MVGFNPSEGKGLCVKKVEIMYCQIKGKLEKFCEYEKHTHRSINKCSMEEVM